MYLVTQGYGLALGVGGVREGVTSEILESPTPTHLELQASLPAAPLPREGEAGRLALSPLHSC